MYEDFIKAVDSSETIAIISHQNPDGDTCGSALALYRALNLYAKKNVYLFCDSNIKDSLKVLYGSENYNKCEVNKCDLAIACDCADMDRMGKNIAIFLLNLKFLSISIITRRIQDTEKSILSNRE